MSTKKIITLCAFLLPIISFGQNIEIKLNCQLSLSRQFKSGNTETETIIEDLEIFQTNSNLSILSSTNSGKLASVTTMKNPSTVSFNNNSDQNRWSMEHLVKMDGHLKNTTYNIDRNTGIIFYSSDYRLGDIKTIGHGNCKKVDTTKRLF